MATKINKFLKLSLEVIRNRLKLILRLLLKFFIYFNYALYLTRRAEIPTFYVLEPNLLWPQKHRTINGDTGPRTYMFWDQTYYGPNFSSLLILRS